MIVPSGLLVASSESDVALDPLPSVPFASLADGAVVFERPFEPAAEPEVLLGGLLEEEGVLTPGWSLSPLDVRTSPAGTHHRYRFVAESLELFGHQAALHIDPDGKVWFAQHSLPGPLPSPAVADLLLSADEAVRSVGSVLPHDTETEVLLTQPGWSLDGAKLRPVWRIETQGHDDRLRDPDAHGHDHFSLRHHVDAVTGKVLHERDLIVHYTNGTGMVYRTSPIVEAQDYDMLDVPLGVDTPQLNALREEVTLIDLVDTGFDRGRLIGRHAEVRDNVRSDDLVFDHDRFDPAFEATMAYYHTDLIQRVIQPLNLTDINDEPQSIGNVLAVGGLPNAYYSYGCECITMLSKAGPLANADASEDGEVIIHENGHAIHHDQVPDWGDVRDQRSMGEGFSDFLAAAILSHDSDGFGDDCMGEWLTSHVPGVYYEFPGRPCMRVLNNTYTYSQLGNAPIHTAGQIWSGHLYDVWQEYGVDVALRLALTSHFFMDGTMGMTEAADLLIVADRVLYDHDHSQFLAEHARARQIDGPWAAWILGEGPEPPMPDPDDDGGGGHHNVTYTAEAIPASPRDTSGWQQLSLFDDETRTITIPETMFFGEAYDRLHVSSNGFVSFTSSDHGCCGAPSLPSGGSPDGLVAGAWTDLDPGAGGRIAYSTADGVTSVSFEQVSYYGGGGSVSFRIDITTDGAIEVHVLDLDGGPTVTTGIESPGSTWGLELRRASGPTTGEAWRLVPEGAVIVPGAWTYGVESIDARPIDISGWTELPMLDDQVVTLEIPRTRFYNLNSSTLHVSSNGFVSFGTTTADGGCCEGGTIPAPDGNDGILAPLWTDLDPKRCGTVAYEASNGSLRVAFVGVPYYGSDCGPGGATATFWLGIDGHGNAEVHILEAAGGPVATTGIEAVDGTSGNVTRQSDAPLGAAVAWRFPLLRLDPPGPGPDPEPEPEPVDPSVATHHFNGTIACGASALVVRASDLCRAAGDASEHTFRFPIQRGATAVHVEVTWEPASDHPAEELEFGWSGPFGLLGASGGSPLIFDQTVDQDLYWIDTGANATLNVGVAHEQGVVLDQGFHVCVVMRYGGADLPETPCALPT